MSKGLVIFDSGHAKNTSGKVAPDKSLYEWDFNNEMQYKLKKRCENHGLKVCLTNPTPDKTSDIPLSTRAAKANEFYKSNGKPKTIMISLHANAYGKWTSARGVEVFHASNASQNSKNLAKYLCDQIYTDVKKIDSNFKNRGVKCEDFTVIYKTITPTCLIEYAFYTNKYDLKILKNSKDELVEATVKAICKYFGITYKTPKKEANTSQSDTSNNSTYTVKVTTDVLNVRSGPGTNYSVTTKVKKGEVYTIVETKGMWGKLKSGVGWICLDYTSKNSTSNTIQVGSKVKVTGSNYATGQSIPSWVKKETYTVGRLDGNKALIKEITSWVYVKDLRLA